MKRDGKRSWGFCAQYKKKKKKKKGPERVERDAREKHILFFFFFFIFSAQCFACSSAVKRVKEGKTAGPKIVRSDEFIKARISDCNKKLVLLFVVLLLFCVCLPETDTHFVLVVVEFQPETKGGADTNLWWSADSIWQLFVIIET